MRCPVPERPGVVAGFGGGRRPACSPYTMWYGGEWAGWPGGAAAALGVLCGGLLIAASRHVMLGAADGHNHGHIMCDAALVWRGAYGAVRHSGGMRRRLGVDGRPQRMVQPAGHGRGSRHTAAGPLCVPPQAAPARGSPLVWRGAAPYTWATPASCGTRPGTSLSPHARRVAGCGPSPPMALFRGVRGAGGLSVCDGAGSHIRVARTYPCRTTRNSTAGWAARLYAPLRIAGA